MSHAEEVAQLAYETALRSDDLFRDSVKAFRILTALVLTSGNTAIGLIVALGINRHVRNHPISLAIALGASSLFFFGSIVAAGMRSGFFRIQSVDSVMEVQSQNTVPQVRLMLAEAIQDAVASGIQSLTRWTRFLQVVLVFLGIALGAWITVIIQTQ